VAPVKRSDIAVLVSVVGSGGAAGFEVYKTPKRNRSDVLYRMVVKDASQGI
jgi:hypothetical protein